MNIEKKIAIYCGTTLAGLKPANLVSISKTDYRDIHNSVYKVNNELNVFDIFVDILCECEKRVLFFVYNRKNLYDYINQAEFSEFLNKYGYPNTNSLEDCIEFLKSRIATEIEFPHEIGVFLGYPLCDVYGFIQNKNDGCLYTGYWKVYNNVEQTKLLFAKYDNCRNRFLKLINNGATLTDLVMAS